MGDADVSTRKVTIKFYHFLLLRSFRRERAEGFGHGLTYGRPDWYERQSHHILGQTHEVKQAFEPRRVAFGEKRLVERL